MKVRKNRPNHEVVSMLPVYNEAVTEYNKKVRLFPGSLVAGMFGFEQRDYYESQDGSDTAPNVPI